MSREQEIQALRDKIARVESNKIAVIVIAMLVTIFWIMAAVSQATPEQGWTVFGYGAVSIAVCVFVDIKHSNNIIKKCYARLFELRDTYEIKLRPEDMVLKPENKHKDGETKESTIDELEKEVSDLRRIVELRKEIVELKKELKKKGSK